MTQQRAIEGRFGRILAKYLLVCSTAGNDPTGEVLTDTFERHPIVDDSITSSIGSNSIFGYVWWIYSYFKPVQIDLFNSEWRSSIIFIHPG